MTLNQTYYGPDGDPFTFWSLAPPFCTESLSDTPRSFVWLYSPARKVMIHAAVSSNQLLAVKWVDTKDSVNITEPDLFGETA